MLFKKLFPDLLGVSYPAYIQGGILFKREPPATSLCCHRLCPLWQCMLQKFLSSSHPGTSFIVRHLVQRPCSGYLYGQEVILCFSESEGFIFLFSFEEHFIGYIAIVAVAS